MIKSNDIFVNTHGKDSPKAARFGEGARTREEVNDAIDKRNASMRSDSRRRYSER